MTKLHELLAVEGPLKTQAEKTRGELEITFEKKRHLFTEKVVTFTPSVEGGVEVREEQLDLQSTIPFELLWISGIWSKALDAAYQIADANTQARADVILDDDTVLLTNVPATALLELEKRAEEIRELASKIPTLDPAKGFKLDEARGKFVYQARPTSVTRTKKVQKALVLYEATKEHPAQVKEISVDDPVGVVQTREWSGLITPAEKSEILDRAERVKRAIKQARSRANSVEIDVKKNLIGQKLLNFVFGV
jgi:hypothetical protein